MPDQFTDADVPLPPPLEGGVVGPQDAAIDLILLDPATVTLFRTGGSAVRATIADAQIGSERSWLRVQIARAFPLSRPDEYIGLRDDKDKDIGMLESLVGLDAASQVIVQEELSRRYFLPRVLRFRSVKEEYGTVTFEVETDKGVHTYVIQNLRDAVQELTPTRVLLTDKDGNRFEIPDTNKLDAKTAEIMVRVL